MSLTAVYVDVTQYDTYINSPWERPLTTYKWQQIYQSISINLFYQVLSRIGGPHAPHRLLMTGAMDRFCRLPDIAGYILRRHSLTTALTRYVSSYRHHCSSDSDSTDSRNNNILSTVPRQTSQSRLTMRLPQLRTSRAEDFKVEALTGAITLTSILGIIDLYLFDCGLVVS